MQKMFRYPIFSETQKVSPTMFFDTVRHQLFDRKLWCPLFLLSLKVFDARSVLKHRKDHLQSFSTIWEKRFPTQLSYIPFLCKRFFDTSFFLKHRSFPLRCISILWDINFSAESCDVPCFFNPWNVWMPEVFWNLEGTNYKVFRHCETKDF